MSDQAVQQVVLGGAQWRVLRAEHERRAQGLLGAVAERRRRGHKHPVEDFLFDYYNLRPGQLVAWHPGLGRRLADAEADFAGVRGHVVIDGLVEVDVDAVVTRRGDTIAWMHRLLSATDRRPAHFGCFGMHEWAMVYRLRSEQTRHAYLPLRYGPERIAEIVDAAGLRCSHFDAFRFFTPDAAPRNTVQLTRADQVDRDQPGCLHVSMDLYKWAGKLLPLTPPELLLDTFELARDVRELDMRASAYDLRGWGYEPVPVETPAGRAEYVARQREFTARAEPLRRRLLGVLDGVQAPALG